MDSMAMDRETGPSWARPNWPVATLDANNLGLDPTEATIAEIGEAAQAIASAAGVTDEAAIRSTAPTSSTCSNCSWPTTRPRASS